MNQIAKTLTLENVVIDADISSKKRLFEQAGLFFENNNGIGRAVVYDALFAREKLGSTGLGQGIAIPHGRIKGLKEAVGAFFRLQTPIPFDSPDGQAVHMTFILLVPESANERHLQLLSELAQMFSDRQFREALSLASDATTVHDLFTQWQEH